MKIFYIVVNMLYGMDIKFINKNERFGSFIFYFFIFICFYFIF